VYSVHHLNKLAGWRSDERWSELIITCSFTLKTFQNSCRPVCIWYCVVIISMYM